MNGGVPSIQSPNTCQCVFPYVNGPQGICELNECIASNTESVSLGMCQCKNGYSQSRCELNICQGNGQYLNNTCVCDKGYAGIFCEVKFSDYRLQLIADNEFLSSTAIASSTVVSTGVFIDSSSTASNFIISSTGAIVDVQTARLSSAQTAVIATAGTVVAVAGTYGLYLLSRSILF